VTEEAFDALMEYLDERIKALTATTPHGRKSGEMECEWRRGMLKHLLVEEKS
jgi:hypothetical protein